MTSTSVIRSLTLSTLMVIAFASVTNGQGGYTIRTVSGEPNFRVTATNGCADEIRLVQQDGADNQPIRWYQFFYLFRGSKIVNIGDLKEGDNVQIDRCNRSLRVSEDGEVKLVNSNDTATIFTIRNLRDVAGEPNSKFVVFEVELKGKRGYFLTNPNTDTNPPTNSKFVLRPGSDYVNNPRNVFKLIYKPSVVDFPSCSGEACNDVFIDGIEGRIYWTNRGNRTFIFNTATTFFRFRLARDRASCRLIGIVGRRDTHPGHDLNPPLQLPPHLRGVLKSVPAVLASLSRSEPRATMATR